MARPFDPHKESPRDLSRIADAFVDAMSDAATKRSYLARFPEATNVLDVGCGQGRFLDAARERGLESLGLDASAEACAACVSRGHTVVHGDALVLLKRLHEERRRFAAVLLAHVVEHCDGAAALDLVAACARVLQPGGRLLVATPNAKNLVVLEEVFWLDPSHVRPYPRALLEQMGRSAGSRSSPATTTRRPRRVAPRGDVSLPVSVRGSPARTAARRWTPSSCSRSRRPERRSRAPHQVAIRHAGDVVADDSFEAVAVKSPPLRFG